LIPEHARDPEEVFQDRHFRSKRIAEQIMVHTRYAADYSEAKVLQVMTAAVLNDVVGGEPRMLASDGRDLHFLRCAESNSHGG
jgi:hypothetical protein